MKNYLEIETLMVKKQKDDCILKIRITVFNAIHEYFRIMDFMNIKVLFFRQFSVKVEAVCLMWIILEKKEFF